ncbi:hypothetical protein [Sphingomonas glaciei]|uniref:DUF4142 domain-containing protein n=1 Tax=Sphingomonas glaciei TaxID=2938948 RepID=A0ABY5MW78_9SPHN|nr:hypothetical protein [Sphingomonas glaciei]UUR08234.1 hypothetical protein M1K48_00880 [Sphingomonas glaciei]
MRRLPHRPALVALSLFVSGLAGCASVKDAPSLARRPAEAIDPRLPIVDRSDALPADPALAAALRGIAAPAFAQARTVDGAIARAETLAAAAGPSGSESWISAQQSLSAAIAAQEPVTRAIGAFDAAVAERIASGARLVPRDLDAVRAIAGELAQVDSRHRAAIASIQRRLTG